MSYSVTMEKTIIVCLSVIVIFAATDGSPPTQLRGQNLSHMDVKISQEEIPPGRKTLNRDVDIIPRKQQSTDMKMEVLHEENTTDTDKISQEKKISDIDERIPLSLDSSPPGVNKTRTIGTAPESDTTLLRDLSLDQDYVFYQKANGSFKLHRTPATWPDARLICYDEGAELASPEDESLSQAMCKVLLTTRQPPSYVFTGINDLYSKGFFTSLKGTPLAAMPASWAPDEPDNVNHGNNCLTMQRNGLLLDSKCDDVYPYICYKRQPQSQFNFCGTTNMDYVYDKNTNSCYKFHTEVATWHDAYATCSREGGHLAIANSEVEAKVLSQMFPADWGVAAIGYSYWRKDLWMTIHGQTLTEAGYETWGKGEPNDWQEQRCGAVFADGTLDDIGCLRMSGYICEKKSLIIPL